MSAKRLALIVVPVLFLVSIAWAQDTSNLSERNELSVHGGANFCQHADGESQNPTEFLPIHFGNPLTLGGDYARLIKHHKIFGLYAELPVAFCPKMNLNYRHDLIPANYKSLFVTPSVRLNIFSGQGFTPWVSAGGGYGRFFESSNLIWGGQNPGPDGHQYLRSPVRSWTGCVVLASVGRAFRSEGLLLRSARPECSSQRACQYRKKPPAQLLRGCGDRPPLLGERAPSQRGISQLPHGASYCLAGGCAVRGLLF